MKSKLLLIVALLLSLIGCQKEDSELSLSKTIFNGISNEGGSLKIEVTSDVSWRVESDAEWCVADQMGNSIILSVAPNMEQEERTATVTITTNDNSKKIVVRQQALVITGNYRYKIPIIFHVFYKDKNDRNQYVDEGRFAEAMKDVNEKYNPGRANSVDMDVEFVLTTHDPKGNKLDEPGVERIKCDFDEMNYVEFVSDITNKRYLWDPNQYINVMVLKLDNTTTLGATFPPYTTKSNPLPGISISDNAPITIENLTYVHCIILNNRDIYALPLTDLFNDPIEATLVHEFGHYLGLNHCYSEDEFGREDTDYCLDTPTYNRDEYNSWIDEIYDGNMDNGFPPYNNNPPKNKYEHSDWLYKYFNIKDILFFDILTKRYDGNGEEFISTNIMDYYFGHLREFTKDQRKRVRHILNYGLLMPGPKIKTGTKSYAVSGTIDLPRRIIE